MPVLQFSSSFLFRMIDECVDPTSLLRMFAVSVSVPKKQIATVLWPNPFSGPWVSSQLDPWPVLSGSRFCYWPKYRSNYNSPSLRQDPSHIVQNLRIHYYTCLLERDQIFTNADMAQDCVVLIQKKLDAIGGVLTPTLSKLSTANILTCFKSLFFSSFLYSFNNKQYIMKALFVP